MNPICIKVSNFSYAYREKVVFDNLNGTIEIGKRTAIMAPSGCGKTTLLFLLAGLLKLQSGTVEYPFADLKFSMVFQENRLLEEESIYCNLSLVNSALSEEQVEKSMKKVGLFMPVSKKVTKLSGGEKRRVAILRALLADYDVLLLDEPFTGLDEETKYLVMNLVKESTAEKTVLLVTHDFSEAEYLQCEISSFFT